MSRRTPNFLRGSFRDRLAQLHSERERWLESIREAKYFIGEIVHPWIDVTSFSKPRDIPSIQEIEPAAFFEWGAASTFNTGSSFREKARGLGFSIKPGEESFPDIEYFGNGSGELERWVNPDDLTQFVEVERFETSQWVTGNSRGVPRRYTFNTTGPES